MAEILYYENGKPKTAADFQSIPKNLDGFTWGQTPGSVRRIIFLSVHGAYQKGDILWLEPPTYDTRSTPPKLPAAGGAAYPYTVPAAEAFMGKAKAYSEPTQFRQYAVRLRALKDNPRNPAEVGAIGVDWAVDEPSAIVEEGSSSNGSYTMYAGRRCVQIIEMKNNLPAGAFMGRQEPVAFPISFSTAPTVGNVWVNSGSDFYIANVSTVINVEIILYAITASGAIFLASTTNTLQTGGTKLKAVVEGIV